MKHTISHRYCWYDFEGEREIVKVYFINDYPFTFDDLPSIAQEDPDLIDQANKNIRYDPIKLYKSSGYLIMEECHPCFFEMDLENPDCLPCD